MGCVLDDCCGFLAAFGAICLVYFGLKAARALYSLLILLICKRLGPAVDLRKCGQWAVITGCTSGIGKSYATELAKKGLDLVLISRSASKLSDQAAEIEKQFKVKTLCIAVDFTKSDIYDEILRGLAGLDIGVLVNNVGMFNGNGPEYFCNMDIQFNMNIVNCNVLSNIMMTGIVLPGMLERRRGVIINISSSSGMHPTPLAAAYSASKAFVTFLSRTLGIEYSSEGVTFQTIGPNLVDTSMSEKITRALDSQASLTDPLPDTFVQSALPTVGRLSLTEGYWVHYLQDLILHSVPDLVFLKIMQRARKQVQDSQRKEQ